MFVTVYVEIETNLDSYPLFLYVYFCLFVCLFVCLVGWLVGCCCCCFQPLKIHTDIASFLDKRNIHKMTGASQSSKDLQTAQSQVIVEVAGLMLGSLCWWNEPFWDSPPQIL